MAIVDTRAIGPLVAMLAALILALILLLAVPVKAQETTAEELTVSQNQVGEGSESQAASDDVSTDLTSGIPAGTLATGSNPDSPSSPPDLITINRSDCTVVQGASITVEDGDGTEARFVDGDNDIEIRADANRVRIEGPNDDFIGDHAFFDTSDESFDTDGDYRVVTDTGVTCRSDNNNRNNDNNRNNNRNNDDGGAANRQYDGDDEEIVIKETIPDKGKLADTGGVPLAGVAFLALASVGLGLSILRFSTRRDP